MKIRESKTLTRFLTYLFLAVFASAAASSAQTGPSGNVSVREALFVLASNIGAPVLDSAAASTVLYSVSSTKNLVLQALVLQGSSTHGARNWLPEGVSSINEVGRYLIVQYPHDVPCCAIFIPEDDPRRFESIRVNAAGSGGISSVECGLGLVLDRESATCELWELASGPFADAKGRPLMPTITLQRVCEKPGGQPFIEDGQRADYRNIRFDGVAPADRECVLSSQNGQIVKKFLQSMPDFPITALPPDLPPLTGVHGVLLEAASGQYLIVNIKGNDNVDRNTNVFVQTVQDGRWKRLPVLAVGVLGDRPENMDRMFYRLFDNWLVTSASAALQAANQITESVVPAVLTVVPTGKQWTDWGIKSEPRSAPDVATLPARRITLWNLADGRRIDLAIPEDDSEVVHIFDNHRVLLRFHDKLFFATIEGAKLTDYKLVAFDSAIPMVHWAWYAENNGRAD